MAPLTLIIGNKNYSSWSLRPWMLLRHIGLDFTEQVIPLDRPDSTTRIQAVNPAGTVPVLRHGALVIWESLAICEYLCDLTGRGLPPAGPKRALARSVSAEMHSGFEALRTAWPMNARAVGRRTEISPALARDIARIDSLWSECRSTYGASGPWLFGDYSLADAMYAPVALRFRTYGAQLSLGAQRYLGTVLEDSILREWIAAAAAEVWVLSVDTTGL